MIGDLLFLLLLSPWLAILRPALAVLGVVAVLAGVLGFTAWWARVDDPEAGQ